MAYIGDLTAIMGISTVDELKTKNSTDKKAGAGLDMTDFLTLMVAMFQNQDIYNTASTTDMMNQMVQMSVVQAITDISTLINDTQTLTYAASLVGKHVVIGKYNGMELEEIPGYVTGTGMLNGEQVVFVNNTAYKLSEIMAVGELPRNLDDAVGGVDDTTNKNDNTDKTDTENKTDNTDKTDTTDKTEGTENTENTGNNPVDNPNDVTTGNGEDTGKDEEPREDLTVNLMDHMMTA